MKRARVGAAVVLGGVALASVLACDRGTQSSALSVASVPATSAPPAVARIVFIDQVNACECTRARIDGTWAALAAALGQPPALPVERIHLDVQRAQATAYTMFAPLMVAPGVYFIDSGEHVVEMLQGEVTAEAIRAVLQRPGGAPASAPVSAPARAAAGHGHASEAH